MYLKILISVFCIVLTNSSYGQIGRKSLIGEYSCVNVTKGLAPIDTIEIQVNVNLEKQLATIVFSEFYNKILIMKRCHRVKIIDKSPINDLGLNVDHPTIYGKFKIVGDSIFIHAKYSIQHFNKLAPKRRVKTKVDKTYKFKIINENQLKVSPNYLWIKNTFHNKK